MTMHQLWTAQRYRLRAAGLNDNQKEQPGALSARWPRGVVLLGLAAVLLAFGVWTSTAQAQEDSETTHGQWERTDDMSSARESIGTAVLDGPACDADEPPDYCDQILLVGGDGRDDAPDTSELYDPETEQFHSAAELPAVPEGAETRRFEPNRRTTVLDGPACRGSDPPDHCGKVLAVGDWAGDSVLYDPGANAWEGVQSIDDIAEFEAGDGDPHAAALLDGPECREVDGEPPAHCGKVLVVQSAGYNPPRSWLYEPTTKKWTETGSANEDRERHAVAPITGAVCEGDAPPNACGTVLMTSGTQGWPGGQVETAELYDPEDGEWRYTENEPEAMRNNPTATTLPDGTVVFAGGSPAGDLVEAFNPADESWSTLPALPEERSAHSSTLTADGRVMLAGGSTGSGDDYTSPASSVVVFDPDAEEWAHTDSMTDKRKSRDVSDPEGFALVTLPDGRVLVAGGHGEEGEESFGTGTNSAELYTPTPGAVEGLVLDADTGEPVEGAEVTVTDDDEQVGAATTSEDGTYQVADVAFGEYTVTADAAGYQAASEDGVAVEVGETTRVDFALEETTTSGGGGGGVTEPADGLVAGTVTDADTGENLEGVEVTADGPDTATTTTDADGAYELAGLSPGSYSVTADTDGYEAASQSVEVGEGETVTVDFALQPGTAAAETGSVAGVVTDADSDDAVVGAEVTVTDDGSEVVTAGTDTDGGYTVEGLAPGEYTFTADASGYEATAQAVTVAGGETATADFALQPVTEEEPVDEEPTAALGDLTSTELVQAACDPAAVPTAGFGDVAGSVHEDSIACVAWYGLTLGLGDLDGDGEADYGPNQSVTRDQMASFINRLAVEAGVALPDTPPDAFGDDDGSVHEEAINQLAALGLVQGVEEGRYAPRALVTRDQMASFLARLASEAGLDLVDNPPDVFGDDDGSVHEDNINALAAANMTRGVSDAAYAPRNPVSRGQMASFLGRLLGGFVEAGIAPEGGGEVTLDRTSTASGGQLAGEVFAHKDVVSLTADGCGLSERDLSVAADGGFTVDIPADQAAGDCQLAFAVDTTRGGDAPVQTARYGFGVTVEEPAGGA